MIDKE
jgi:hypothetical protein